MPFNTVVGIRSKKAKGEKLDKWEKKFYQENKNIIDIKHVSATRSKRIKMR